MKVEKRSHGINRPDPSISDLGDAYYTGFGCIGGTMKGETAIKCDARKGRYNRNKNNEIVRNAHFEREQIQKIIELEKPMIENIKKTLKERFTTITI